MLTPRVWTHVAAVFGAFLALGGASAQAASMPALHAAPDREIRDTHDRQVLLRRPWVQPPVALWILRRRWRSALCPAAMAHRRYLSRQSAFDWPGEG